MWDDSGYLLSKNKFSENSVIAEIYTENHGKCSGIIYGGTSRKIVNYLQLGNKVAISFKSKNENNIGYFKIEIIEPIAPYFFDNKEKILILNSTLNLLKILTPELQKNKKIYEITKNFLSILKIIDEKIILRYLDWEIFLLKEIGYDLNLSKYIDNNLDETVDYININSNNNSYKIPIFLINKKYDKIDYLLVLSALKFVGNYLNNEIFVPNNFLYPKFRKNLENFYK